MLTKKAADVYRHHTLVHGDKHRDRLIDQAIEEAAELIVALSHYRSERCNTDRFAEEYADLRVCMEFLFKTVGVQDDFMKMAADVNLDRIQRGLLEQTRKYMHAATVHEEG